MILLHKLTGPDFAWIVLAKLIVALKLKRGNKDQFESENNDIFVPLVFGFRVILRAVDQVMQ